MPVATGPQYLKQARSIVPPFQRISKLHKSVREFRMTQTCDSDWQTKSSHFGNEVCKNKYRKCIYTTSTVSKQNPKVACTTWRQYNTVPVSDLHSITSSISLSQHTPYTGGMQSFQTSNKTLVDVNSTHKKEGQVVYITNRFSQEQLNIWYLIEL